MSVTTLDWRLGVALVALVAAAVGASVATRLRLERQVVVAAVRAVLQLAAVSFLVTAALTHLAWAAAFALLMFAIAVRTSAVRCGVGGCWPWVALAMAAGIVPVLVIVFASGASPLNGAALVPIAGIIIGNTMTGHTLVARREFDALRDHHGEYEAGLAIGLTRAESIGEVTERVRAEALIPTLDSTRTVGLVTLPGAFVGVLLGGGSPMQAGAAQLLVLFGIVATQFCCVAVAHRLIGAARVLPEDLREKLRV
ncbi:ABC transporter permease [Mariniluteicoccus flavus]